MLHMIRSVHVGMKWHAMTYALHLCTRHHFESCVNAWLGSTLCLVFDHGKSTLCLVFDGGLDILDYIQWSLTGAFQLFWNKIVYWRLSNVCK